MNKSSSKWADVLNRDEVNFVKEDEGEFWYEIFFKLYKILSKIFLKHIILYRMSYEDFMRTWDRLYVCHLTPASFISEIDKNSNVSKPEK